MISFLSKIDTIDIIKNSISKPSTNFDDEISILEKQLKTNLITIDNLVDKLVLLSDLASKAITDKIEKLSVKNQEIKEKIETLKLNQLESSISASPEQILNNIKYFNTLTDNVQRRIIIKRILSKIIYDPINKTTEVIFI